MRTEELNIWVGNTIKQSASSNTHNTHTQHTHTQHTHTHTHTHTIANPNIVMTFSIDYV